jgi:hypothetical protein
MDTPYVAGWMLQSDSVFAWRPGRIYIPAMNFTGMSVGAINEGGTGNFAYGAKWESAGTGSPGTAQIGTSGLNGIVINSANGEASHLMNLPFDFDVSKPMYLRVFWTSGSSDTNQNITWLVRYRPIQVDSTALAAATTSLDTPIPVDNVIGANVLQATDWGKINAGAVDPKHEAIVWRVTLSAFSAGLTQSKYLVGLELRYTPKRLIGPTGMMREARAAAYALARHI